MFVCGDCIGDSWLAEAVFPQFQVQSGTCSLCNLESATLIDASNLRDHFQTLLGIYRKDNDGVPLLSLLRDDWRLFHQQRFTDRSAYELLQLIFEEELNERVLFAPSESFTVPHMEAWRELREELKHVNRFFPTTKFDFERMLNLFQLLSLESDGLNAEWFRSRVQVSKRKLSSDEMGAPPPKIATSGRANPVGIPYLYLSSDSETSIAEVRPHPGDKISVAKFELTSHCKFVDLRSPRATVSPFLLDDEQQIGMLRRDIGFLEGLAKELRTPVLPVDAAVDYIPSQYLCEAIKSIGFHGVVYGSSVGQGINLALFNPEYGRVKSVDDVAVTSVTVVTEDVAD